MIATNKAKINLIKEAIKEYDKHENVESYRLGEAIRCIVYDEIKSVKEIKEILKTIEVN